MYFWCLQIDQKNNKFFIWISAKTLYYYFAVENLELGGEQAVFAKLSAVFDSAE